MAKLHNGILGPLTGKIGPVILSSWKGILYAKSQSARKPANNSPRQKEQQLKFVSFPLLFIK